jgi:hypothetical protein
MASEGTFVLADIGGYTAFLTGVGIEHGKETIQHLLNRIIRGAGKRWKVANIMGDCVFFYAPSRLPADQVFASVRALYHAFRDAQLEVADGSTCRCGACDRTEDLTLKFVVHAGQFDVQNIGGRKELIGPEIVLATRLLKNSVPVSEYIIVTPNVPGLHEAAGIDATPVRDELETIGPFDYTYIDLAQMRRDYDENRAFYVTPETASLGVTQEIDAPADHVWSAMSELRKRALWQVTIDSMEHIQGEPGAVGEVHSCLHGNTKIVHATIAVDPEGRRKTERIWVSPPLMKDTYITLTAEPLSPTRTRAALHATFKPRIPVLSRLAWPVFVATMKGMIRKDMAGLKELCETGKVSAREAQAAKSAA